MRRIVTLAAAVLGAIALAPPAGAQTITGKVVDAASGRPVADASVVLLDKNGRIQRGTLTESDGAYTIVCPSPGTFKLRVGGPGLTTWDSPELKVGADVTLEYEIRVHREGSGVIEAFERRRATHEGIFLTADDIAKRGGNRFTDIFQYVPGLQVVPLPSTERHQAVAADDPSLQINRAKNIIVGYFTVRITASHYTGGGDAGARQRGEADHDCPPVLWVDGQWWGSIDNASDLGPDSRLVPQDIAAIEVYTPRQLPPELNSGRDAELCGVISVWRK